MLRIIQNNPYRFLGVCSNAPVRERVANGNRLKAFLSVGKETSFPLDITNLIPPPSRTPEGFEAVNNSINLPKDQLKHALFWFICVSSIDKMALEYLQNGNTAKAIELFGKKEDFSSLINKGVMAFINGNDGEAIHCITKVIHDDEYRRGLVEAVCGTTFTIQEEELAQLFIDSLLEEVPVVKLKDLFSQFGTSSNDNDILNEKVVGQYLDAINSAIADAKSVDNKNASAQLQAGTKLMNSTKKDLLSAKSILGTDDMKYQMVADNLAKHILQCGINYYNNTSEDDDVSIDKAMKIQAYALSIAVGNLTKDRCQENVDILKKKKADLPPQEVRYYDKKINEALANYMKKTDKISYAIDLIKKVIPYLMSIKEVLGDTNKYYLRISTLIVNASLHNIIEEFNSVMNESLEYELLLDRYNTMRKVEAVFKQAWEATLYMDKLDMELEFKKNRYNPNRSSLKKQVESLINIYQPVSLDMRGETQIFNDCRTISDLNNYMRLFPDGKYASQVKEKMESIEFEACRTTKDCQNFTSKYPRSKYDIIAKMEECCFNQCSTVSQYEKYLREYPEGRFVSQARNKIDELSYGSCRDVDDYKRYMTKFPHGHYYSKAKVHVDEEEMWNKCVATNSKDMYKEYLAKYPYGRHKTEAEEKARACYIATMVYGDYNHPQVVALRDFRDNILQNNVLGRTFVRFYYKHSPSWVEKMQGKKTINAFIRKILDQFIKMYNK